MGSPRGRPNTGGTVPLPPAGGGSAAAPAPTTFRVGIPSQLVSYTKTRALSVEVAAQPPRLADVLAALDLRYPGIRFRIVDERGHVRPHMQVFVGHRVERNLAAHLVPGDEVMIVGALSGG